MIYIRIDINIKGLIFSTATFETKTETKITVVSYIKVNVFKKLNITQLDNTFR